MIKTSFVLSVAILAALPAIGSASAAEMPKELRGTWCGRWQGIIYARCREADSEDNLWIDARKFFVAEGTACTPLAITSDGSDYFVRASCTFDEGVRSGRVLQRWRLLNNGRRLEIRDANTGPSGIEPTKIGTDRTVPLPQPRPYTYLPPEAQPTEEEKQEAWRSVQGELPWVKSLPHLPAATPATGQSVPCTGITCPTPTYPTPDVPKTFKTLRTLPPRPTLPPEKFDKPYQGKLHIIKVDDNDFVGFVCDTKERIIACAVHIGWNCLIVLGPSVWDDELTMRHEIGHCNGWPKDHPGMRGP